MPLAKPVIRKFEIGELTPDQNWLPRSSIAFLFYFRNTIQTTKTADFYSKASGYGFGYQKNTRTRKHIIHRSPSSPFFTAPPDFPNWATATTAMATATANSAAALYVGEGPLLLWGACPVFVPHPMVVPHHA